ncbi:Guanine nucleotide-binding protein alpha-17 subunit (Odorant response abnormal protein 3) [Durusdinium trenchii]|uniref:Guanine nucleotide-binding protein alpha-17 subunit (Odorant response abnormal protein 3) n=1 Tax=Durusdinium trenchii TaxID=1381693 RepID=A0ABP0LU93_9DINO
MRLAQDRKVEQGKLKLLLLGAGESGKSTIFKQMKLLYGAGITQEERFKIRPFVIGNLIEGACDIYQAGEPLGVSFRDEVQAAGEMLIDLPDKRTLTDEVVDAINLMWNDEDFRGVWNQRSKFQVQDTWNEFADALGGYPQWGGPDWTPTTDEILRCRVRTTGVVDEEFLVKNVKLRMLDVGGQRNERRKWIHCFENVTSVLFVASLSEYDQVLFEDSSKNRLVESLELFEEISNSEWFLESAMILFLNKSDLFEKKYMEDQVPLNVTGLFPDAPGGEPDLDKAYAWFEQKFKDQCKDPERTIFVHTTNATDTGMIDAVMRSSSQHILRQNLKGSGVLV